MNDKQLRRNLLFNTVGNAVYYACQWLVTAWLVTGVPLGIAFADGGVENAGLLATAATACNIFVNLAGFGMRTFQVSDLAGEFADSVYERSRFLTVSLAAALCMIYAFAAGYGDRQLLAVLLFLLFKLLEPLTDVWHGFLQKAGRMDVIGVAYAARGLLSAGAFALALKLSESLSAALLAMLFAAGALCLLYDLPQAGRCAKRGEATLAQIGRLLFRCLPLALYAFLNTAAANLPKLALERLLGVSAAGVYSLVNSPVLILQVGVTYLFTPFITLFSEKLKSRDRAGFLRLALVVCGVDAAAGLLGLLGCRLFGAWGLALLYRNETVTAQSALLYPMVLCVVLSCLSIFFCMLLTVLREMKGLLIANAAGIAVAAAVSAPLIRLCGLAGASLASSAAMAAQCALLAFFGLRALNAQTKQPEG